MVRREAETKAAERGLRVVKSVSSKTDIVVAGPGAGSKLGTAHMHGTEIWDEAKFRQWLEGSEPDADDGSGSDDGSAEEARPGGGAFRTPQLAHTVPVSLLFCP